jgi:EAL domain-containing protein (putative c-di-GMP-specific phosphodiesterase class I)
VRKRRSDAEQQVAELLRTAKESLQLSVAFLSRLDGTTQHLEVVESSVPFLFQDGLAQRGVRFPAAMALPAARMPRIRSYVSVPVVLSDGELYGTFCAAGLTTDKDLTQRDRALMTVLASAAAVVIEPGVREEARRREVLGRLEPVVADGGPVVVLQPIVDLVTDRQVGSEALSRFPAAWGSAPDVVFEEAHSVGLGHRLELLALRRAADHLAVVDGYVAMNISPATLLQPEFTALMRSLPLDRVLLELSEHDQVADYPELAAVLAPLRAEGMRLAIDDVGAGYSSLRHIVLTAPDVLKMDRSVVAGVDTDPVLARLVASLVEFGHGCGAKVVAEGVETAAEAAELRRLQVDLGQGWLFGRPAHVVAAPPALLTPRTPSDDTLAPSAG